MFFTTGAQLQAALNALPASKTGKFVGFDAFYYGQTYLSNNQGTMSPIEHFVTTGAARGNKPNATFDPVFYASSSADLTGKGFDAADLLIHFLRFGLDEGRVPNAALSSFNGTAYLAANADVATFVNANLAQFGGSASNGALAHYVKFGALEGRAATGTSVSNGQTFSLTQGLDTIAGTSGNDTINANAFNNVTGADATTLNSVDTIDGGAGTDTLNLEIKSNASPADFNKIIQGTISNVEIININQTAVTTAAAIDASKFGTAATQIWQIGQEGAVTNLAATTTAGFRNLSVSQTLDIAPVNAAASASVAFDKVAEGSTLNVVSSATGTLSTVNVSGTVVDTNASGAVANTNVAVTVGKDVQTLTLNTGVATDLSIVDGAGTKKITTIDAAASTGAITYADSETTVATITTGSGKDAVTVVTATSKTVGSVVNATVTTNAGDDTVTVNVTGDGNTTVNTGAGDDTVNITGRGSSVLTVNLGDGADTFTSGVAIAATDKIDAGAGSDTLLLNLVGLNNVGAFSNFDVYDVKSMSANLDLDILNTKNTVTEIVGSGALTSATTLLNVGAGVGFRATKDMSAAALTLTQKTAGALTVTLDADETGTADTTIDTAQTAVVASNATSLKAVFDTSYLATIAGETTAGDNVSTITLSGAAATALEVVSGGALAKNVLVYTDTAATAGKLAALTISGDNALDLTFSSTNATALTTVNASTQTGGLTFSLVNLKDGGTVTLGSGTDVITVTNVSTTGAVESISGMEKTAAVSVSVVAGDATAKAAAIAAADVLVLTGATAANANGGVTTATIDKGVLTFTGAGPATLADAIAIANSFADTAGETALFQYIGDSYVFVQGGTDTVVKLVGITGVTNFVESTTADNFFIV